MNRFLVLIYIPVIILIANSTSPAAEKALLFAEKKAEEDKSKELENVWVLVKNELGKQGIAVQVGGDIPVFLPDLESLRQWVNNLGVTRIFIVSYIVLGQKIIITLEEKQISETGLDSVFSERATSTSIEDIDILIPKLVQSVINRKPYVDTESQTTITEKEEKPIKKKFGEFLWGAGFILGSSIKSNPGLNYGVNLKFNYEMTHARLDFNITFQANPIREKLYFVMGDAGAAYLFMTGNISPFIGGNVGFGAIFMNESPDYDGHGFGAIGSVTLGVEFFRLYTLRLLLEFKFAMPMFKVAGHYMAIFSTIFSFLW